MPNRYSYPEEVGRLLAEYAALTAEQIAANPDRSPAKRDRAARDADTLRAALNTDAERAA